MRMKRKKDQPFLTKLRKFLKGALCGQKNSDLLKLLQILSKECLQRYCVCHSPYTLWSFILFLS